MYITPQHSIMYLALLNMVLDTITQVLKYDCDGLEKHYCYFIGESRCFHILFGPLIIGFTVTTSLLTTEKNTQLYPSLFSK